MFPAHADNSSTVIGASATQPPYVEGWRPASHYLNDRYAHAALQDGYGLLLRAPKPIVEEAKAILDHHRVRYSEMPLRRASSVARALVAAPNWVVVPSPFVLSATDRFWPEDVVRPRRPFTNRLNSHFELVRTTAPHRMTNRQPRTRLPLTTALRKYWPWLSGMVIFPVLIACGPNYKTIPQWVVAALFFGCGLPAMWPWLAKGAPYSFWFVALILFFGTFLAAASIAVLLG